MAFGKTAAITVGLIGAFALGVWTGPYVVKRTAPADTVAAVTTTPDNDAADVATPARRAAPRVVGTSGTIARADRATEFVPFSTSVGVSTPALHKALKPYLRSGANMDIAAEGFNSAEQFATVVHASDNTEVPFMLLKHRVLNEGDTLVAAIRKSKPDLDAVVEADRARAEARSDLSQLN